MTTRELIERAREALSIYVDWCNAENDHALVDFNQLRDLRSNAKSARETLAAIDAHLSAPTSQPDHKALAEAAHKLIEAAIDSDASGRPDGALYQHAMNLRAALAAQPDDRKALADEAKRMAASYADDRAYFRGDRGPAAFFKMREACFSAIDKLAAAQPVQEPAGDAGALAKLKASLADPIQVHAALLRGEIAKPDIRDMLHVYGAEALERWDATPTAPVEQPAQVPSGWRDVMAERRRQVSVEGWTPEHDDEHDDFDLAKAAASYTLTAARWFVDGIPPNDPPKFWPWLRVDWKPDAEPRRMLVKAGALILAELERLDRAAAPSAQPTQTAQAQKEGE